MSGDEGDKKLHSGYHGWMKTIPKTNHVRAMCGCSF
jgi:hypothetical protein